MSWRKSCSSRAGTETSSAVGTTRSRRNRPCSRWPAGRNRRSSFRGTGRRVLGRCNICHKFTKTNFNYVNVAKMGWLFVPVQTRNEATSVLQVEACHTFRAVFQAVTLGASYGASPAVTEGAVARRSWVRATFNERASWAAPFFRVFFIVCRPTCTGMHSAVLGAASALAGRRSAAPGTRAVARIALSVQNVLAFGAQVGSWIKTEAARRVQLALPVDTAATGQPEAILSQVALGAAGRAGQTLPDLAIGTGPESGWAAVDARAVKLPPTVRRTRDAVLHIWSSTRCAGRIARSAAQIVRFVRASRTCGDTPSSMEDKPGLASGAHQLAVTFFALGRAGSTRSLSHVFHFNFEIEKKNK